VILKMPEDSYAPFALGAFVALVFAGMGLRAWVFTGLMALGCAVSLVVWLWPRRQLVQREPYRVTGAGGGSAA
jgi:cytochrome c oxidase subunit 1/cytochrome c oxidase subunit I+III